VEQFLDTNLVQYYERASSWHNFEFFQYMSAI